jgi:hypothetical protein
MTKFQVGDIIKGKNSGLPFLVIDPDTNEYVCLRTGCTKYRSFIAGDKVKDVFGRGNHDLWDEPLSDDEYALAMKVLLT